MKQTAVFAQNVSFKYGAELVLEDINFEINKGDFVGIIGPNGSGKTTLLKIMLGLLAPDSGKITIFDKAVKVGSHPEIAYIPQKITQLESRFPITVHEVVMLGRVSKKNLFKRISKHDQDIVEKSLEDVDMLAYKDKIITDLSGGQQQRVFIAKALASKPKLLILDEPTVGVDQGSQEKFYALLQKLNKENGLTVIIVSHDTDVIINEVSTVLCLNKTIVCHLSPKDFIKHDYFEKVYGEHKKHVVHDH